MVRKKPKTVARKARAPQAPAKPSAAPPEAGARARMIEGAARLLASRGLQATSFSEVLEATGAPRGSVYHHFPEGKDQLVGAALDFVTAQMNEVLDRKVGASAEEVTTFFLYVWRTILTRSNFQSGCAVLAVTVATDSEAMLLHTAAIFRAWRARIAEMLTEGGLPAREAARFSATLIAAAEGAVVLSRGEQSLEPFELVAAHLIDEVRRAVARKDDK